MSQLTTHILDTALGKPARNVNIILEQRTENSWTQIATGITNGDGRVADLLKTDTLMKPGYYRLIFDTRSYYEALQMRTFYPQIKVEFEISDGSHYHVPLLLSPYGYSTYRGS